MEKERQIAGDLEIEAGAAMSLREALAQAESRCKMLTRERQELQSTYEESKRTMNFMHDKTEQIVTELNAKTQKIVDLERSLTEKEEMIKSLLDKLTINKEEVAQANNIIEKLKAEIVRKNNDVEEHKTAFEIIMAESEQANAQLKRDLAEETSKLTRAEESLNTIKAEWKIVSTIKEQNVKLEAKNWELQEKCAVLEGNHERLQQNMVQLQINYETLSSQYQEELRRRPEIVNMLMSNRKVYKVLEENLNRIRPSLQRTAADCNALAEAYAQASEKVTAAQADYVSQINAANNATRSAQDLAKLKDEQCTRLSERSGLIRCQAEETEAKLQRVTDQRNYLAEYIARYEAQIQEKEKNIQELRAEIQRASTEYNEHIDTQRKIAADLEIEAGAAMSLREALAQAESRCEMLTRERQELQSAYEESKRTMKFMVEETEQIVTKLNAKTQNIQFLQSYLAKSKQETQTATERIYNLTNELERERREFNERITTANNELQRQREENEKKLTTCLDRLGVENTGERNDFQNKITSQERIINQCNEEILSLHFEIQELKKTRDDSQVTIAELTSTIERERSNKNERIVDLERSLTEKEEMIKSLLDKLTINKDEVAQASDIIEKLKAEIIRNNNNFDEQKTANAQLRRDLAEEKSKLTRVEESLNAIKAERMIVLTAREEDDQSQKKIHKLQATIQKKKHPKPNTPVRVPVAAHLEPPEHDHTAMDVPHTPLNKRKAAAPVTEPVQAIPQSHTTEPVQTEPKRKFFKFNRPRQN